jgi:hypothetical protein
MNIYIYNYNYKSRAIGSFNLTCNLIDWQKEGGKYYGTGGTPTIIFPSVLRLRDTCKGHASCT